MSSTRVQLGQERTTPRQSATARKSRECFIQVAPRRYMASGHPIPTKGFGVLLTNPGRRKLSTARRLSVADAVDGSLRRETTAAKAWRYLPSCNRDGFAAPVFHLADEFNQDPRPAYLLRQRDAQRSATQTYLLNHPRADHPNARRLGSIRRRRDE